MTLRLAQPLSRRYLPLLPYLTWAVFLIGAVYCFASLAGFTGYPADPGDPVAGDAWNYWLGRAYDSEHYRYSPAFYWLTAPLRQLPFDVFVSIWTLVHLVAIAWLGPWTILLAIDDVVRGNVTTFLAVALVLSVRGHPGFWAAPLLTKVTPAVGIVYHAARREWRAVAIALAFTCLFVALTAFDPALWAEWLRSLAAAPSNYDTVDAIAPLPVRIAVGAAVCVAAARWVWLLPIGMVIAMPGLWPSSFALLAAVPRLVRSDRGSPGRSEVPSYRGGAEPHR